MIRKLQYNLVNYLVRDNVITEEERELYEYSIITLTEKTLGVISMLFIAWILDSILAGAVFYISLRELRTYAGGYHAKTFLRCYLLSNLCFTIVVTCIRFQFIYNNIYRILEIIFGIYLLYRGPLDCENKKFEKEEKLIFYRDEAIRIAMIILLCIICFLCKWIQIEQALESAVIMNGITSIMVKKR